MELVLATGNTGKVRELQALLAPRHWRVRAQVEFNCPEAEETGLTFVENALIKARNAARHTGLPALADDSGLACAALQGAPGIYSARYAGPAASDAENVDKLLAALAEVPEQQRVARFICVIAFLRHEEDPCPILAEGSWYGHIAHAPRGSSGFGYDPVFEVPSTGLTAAELPPPQKLVLSHRGQALRAFMQQLDALQTRDD